MEIEWENPPEDDIRQRSGYAQQFVTVLRNNPGNWAVYKRGIKQRSTKMRLIKNYPDIWWKSAPDADGTYTIWGRTKED